MIEFWQYIKHYKYEHTYMVSNLGRVKRVPCFMKSKYGKRWYPEKIMTQCKNSKGYLVVSLAKELKLVHRLVAEAFIPYDLNKLQVNHKDGNKLNNHSSNLEWCTNQENRNHAVNNRLHQHGERQWNHKLTEEQVLEIRNLFINGFNKSQLARKFEVTKGCIRKIIKKQTWRHI